jgi:predicted enzyme related to lactoylglutathione lyase
MGNGQSYTMIALGDETIGGYQEGKGPGWLSHLLVDDARATAAKVKSLGGTVHVEPAPMGPGTFAVVSDPLGTSFALWQPGKPEEGEFSRKVGAFIWNELMTTDETRSLPFWTALGFADKPMNMGPMGTYHVLESANKDRAGMMQTPGAPALWVPYVHVADANATCAKAKKLGATIKMGPDNVPNVGRIAVMADPQGATIGLLEP